MAKLKVWKFFSVWMVMVLVVGLGAALVPARPVKAATIINVPGDCATIQAAINAASPGGTINVAAGTYNEALGIATDDLTIIGAGEGQTTINVAGKTGNLNSGIIVTAAGVTLQEFTLTSDGAAPPASPRYGIKFSHTNNGTLRNITVQGLYRSGVDLNTVSNMTIDQVTALNNGGNGIGCQDVIDSTFSNIITSNNAWGGIRIQSYSSTIHGIVISGTNNLQESAANGVGGLYLEQSNINPAGPPYLITYGTSGSPDVLLQSADFNYAVRGNDNEAPQYSRIWFYKTLDDAQVAAALPAGAPGHITNARYIESLIDDNWYVPSNLGSIQAAIDAASSGDTINVAAGTYAGAIVDKDVTISGAPGGASVITSGVQYKVGGPPYTTAFRLDGGADGAEINNFTINNNEGSSFYFAVFARGADNVTIDALAVNDTVQGITNWGGSGWTITNNTVTDTVAAGGGGIGIFLGATPPDYRTCSNNLVQYNIINATATADDYSCPGICACLDLRYGAYDLLDGTEDVSGNQILNNDITASGVNNGVGIEVGTIIGDSEADPDRTDPAKIAAVMAAAAVHDNTVQQNTADGTDMGIYFYNVTDLTVTLNTIENSVGDGILAEHGQSGTVVLNNTFTNNSCQVTDTTVDTDTLDHLDINSILAGNLFDRAVTVDHPGASLLHTIWSKIQDGIDAAVGGDTINVAAGTYVEAIMINKPLTLRGATYNVNKNGYTVPADYAWDETVESIISHPNPTSTYNAIVDIVDTDDVTFEGFVVQELNAVGNNNASLVRVYAHTTEISNIVVRNNVIGPNTNTTSQDGTHGRMGLYIVNHPYSDQYGVVNSTFSGNKIFDCKGNGNNVFIWSSYYAYGAPGPASMAGTVIEDNEIYGAHRSGIETAGGFSGLTMRNNKIYGNGGPITVGKPALMFGNGILMIRGSGDRDNVEGYGPVNVTIEGNEVYDNDGHGIYMGPNNAGITITHNSLYNNGEDAIIVDLIGNYWNPDFETAPGPHTNLGGSQNIAAHLNSIYGNVGYGAQVIGTPTNGFVLNATNNWWGANDGPSASPGSGDKISANVDADPWLVLNISAVPTSVVVGSVATSAMTADMTKNSDGVDTSAQGYIPDGTQITFTTDKGKVGSLTVDKTTASGIATATLTSSNTVETATVTASAPPHTVAATVSTTVGFVQGAPQKTDCATGLGAADFSSDLGNVTGLTSIDEATLPTAGKPSGVAFPYGLFSFNITNIAPGSTVTVTITYPFAIPAGSQYWKCQGGVWVNCTSLVGDNDGDNVLTLTLTDGGLGDADGLADGTIVDPGGPAAAVGIGGGFGGGGGGGMPPAVTATYTATLTVNMQGSVATVRMTEGGVLGETIVASDAAGKYSLEIDKNARVTLAGNVAPLLLTFRESSATLPTPEDAVIVGRVYEFNAYSSTSATTPSPVTISPPARLILTYDPDELPRNASEVFIAYYDTEKGWLELAAVPGVVAEIDKAYGLVSHFTSFAVLAKVTEPAPAKFSVGSLTVTPSQAKLNQGVNISVNVANNGGTSGSYSLEMKVNGVSESTKQVTIAAGASQTVNFTVTKAQPGTYTVDIAGQRGSFVVLGAGTRWNGGLIAIVIAGVLILATVVVLVVAFRRRAY